MSRRDGRPGWHSDEGRAYARERWQQRRDRAEVDRTVREEAAPDPTADDEREEGVAVADGDRMRPVPGPEALGGVLGDLVRARGWEPALRAARLDSAWEDIVGEQLARISRPGRFRGGVLQVVVAEPRWATQLRYMTEQIVGRVVAETGIPVREVRLVVGDLDD